MANQIASAIASATRSVMYATWPTPLHSTNYLLKHPSLRPYGGRLATHGWMP